MAYICKQLFPASAANHLALIEAELVNMGWVLHDNVSATVKVYKSNAESGVELMQYQWLSLAGNILTFKPYMWWNSGTHAGSSTVTDVGGHSTYAGGGIYVIVGNKDLVLVRRVAAAEDILFGHFPKRFHTTPLATLTAPCGAGMGIVISVDNTTDFVVNQTYWLCGLLGEGRDRANVIGIGIGTITVDNLGTAFGIGAKIGAAPSTFGGSHNNENWNSTWDRVVVGTGNAGSVAIMRSLFGPDGAVTPQFAPDQSLGLAGPPHNSPGMYILQPLLSCLDGASRKSTIGFSDSIFMAPPLYVAETTFGVTADGAPLDTATATAGANFTITCAGRGWVPNIFTNKIVIIASGTGLGQTRKIASNTDEVITVNTQWATNPNATSVFFVVDKAYRVPTTMTFIAYQEEI